MKKIILSISALFLSLLILVGCASPKSVAKEGFDLYLHTLSVVDNTSIDELEETYSKAKKIDYVYYKEEGKETVLYRISFTGEIYSAYFKYVIENKEGSLKILDKPQDFLMFDNALSDVTNGKFEGEHGSLVE